MASPLGVRENARCSRQTLGTLARSLSMARTTAALRLSSLTRSGVRRAPPCHLLQPLDEARPVLDQFVARIGGQQLGIAERRRDAAPLFRQRIDARLHVESALAAGLEGIDAHDMVLGQPVRQRFDRIGALEFGLRDLARHESIDLAGRLQIVGHHGDIGVGIFRRGIRDFLRQRRRQRRPRIDRRHFAHVVDRDEHLTCLLLFSPRGTPRLDLLPVCGGRWLEGGACLPVCLPFGNFSGRQRRQQLDGRGLGVGWDGQANVSRQQDRARHQNPPHGRLQHRLRNSRRVDFFSRGSNCIYVCGIAMSTVMPS